ncbi:MAG: peptidoglycan-binding protein, partial [Planctomycetota bacterium]
MSIGGVGAGAAEWPSYDEGLPGAGAGADGTADAAAGVSRTSPGEVVVPDLELGASVLRRRLDDAEANAVSYRRPELHDDPLLQEVAAGDATLEIGSEGEAVTRVQLALLDLGYDLGSAGADGQYGPAVQRAVRALQQDAGLEPTGVVDARTLERLEALAPPLPRDPAQPLIEEVVGPRGANRIADVKAVQQRLAELGFYDGRINGHWSASLARSLKLFDAVVGGREMVARSSSARRRASTLSPGEETERWLRAANAPRWERVPAGGTGWSNGDRDGHSWATNWLVDALGRAGRRYASDYLAENPGASEIVTNDASRRLGGDTPDHATHETGLDLDVKLGAGGVNIYSGRYDREETWAKIK